MEVCAGVPGHGAGVFGPVLPLPPLQATHAAVVFHSGRKETGRHDQQRPAFGNFSVFMLLFCLYCYLVSVLSACLFPLCLPMP